MMGPTRVSIHPDFDVLAATTAARLITRLLDVQNERGEATVVLTGGALGTATLKAVADSPACSAVNWSKVNFWWGDDRFVPSDHADRNCLQADNVLLNHIPVDPSRIHRIGASDQFSSPDEAAAAYELELRAAGEAEFEPVDESDQPPLLPCFDVLLLGVGPDAHVASLFPEMAGIRDQGQLAVGVENAPQPPPRRVSLTLAAINSAEEVWLAVAGSDKAGAVGLALAGAGPVQVPAAGPRGKKKTLWLIDQDAAAKIPVNLIYAH